MVLFVGSIFMLTACGKKKDYSGTLGSCTFSESGVSICSEYSYSGSLKDDPASDAAASAQSSCKSSDSATYSSTGTCSRTGATGTCTISATKAKDDENFTVTAVIVFPAAINVSSGTSICTSSGGTYKAL